MLQERKKFVNITNYYAQGDENAEVYRGRMTLQSDFSIVDADEIIYEFLGKNSALSMPALAHNSSAKKGERPV